MCINASLITAAMYLVSSVTSGIYRWLCLRLPNYIHRTELIEKVNNSKHRVASIGATPCFFLVMSERMMCGPLAKGRISAHKIPLHFIKGEVLI